MGFFKRKKDEEVKIQLEREALDKLNGNTTNIFDINNPELNTNVNSGWQINGKVKAPHTITAEELNAKAHKNNHQYDKSEAITMENQNNSTEESPTTFLYQKMMQSRALASENSIQATNSEEGSKEISNEQQPEKQAKEQIIEQTTESIEKNAETTLEEPVSVQDPIDINAAINDLKNLAKSNGHNEESNNSEHDSHTTSPSLEESSTPVNEEMYSEVIENEIKTTNSTTTETEEKLENIGNTAEERRTTLLARCNAFLEDASVPTKTDSAKYKLESVESILKDFEERAAERINKKFSSGNYFSATPSVFSSLENDKTDSTKEKTEAFESTIVFDKPTLPTETTEKAAEPKEISDTNEVKHLFTAAPNFSTSSSSFEDIYSTKVISDISSHSTPDTTSDVDKTAVFPVVESKADNIHTEGTYHEENLQPNETINHIEDYTGVADRQKILSSLLHKKRAFLTKTLLSVLAFVVGILTLSPISGALQISTSTASVLDVLICAFISILNFNVFSGISALFTKKQKNSLPTALSLIFATIFSILNLIFKENLIGFSAIAALTVFSYNLANNNFYFKTIKNFNLIANSETKKAVSIIQNKNATKAIVGNSIEGSSLICYGGETTNIHNFLKYTYCKNPTFTTVQKISIVGVIIGFGLALASLILSIGNLLFAFYIFATAICFTSLPLVYHIVTLTVNSANKRLNHYDAMITGYRAADELELCNGIALSSDSLFPEGTIRLVDMKLLSPNPFDQSMLDAAAIATAIHSPIAGIFKQIDTAQTYKVSAQEVDSVIYEEKMGISGWVNDRRVFVGNRDLLIAHGFAGLPPAELDKKIMRKGYFPIYIASNNILCALLIVKYEPDEDITYEIQRLANTGTTILVDNCDPNINSKMLTDYFGLYDESIFVMSKQGSDYYKALITHKEHRRAGASYTSCIEGLLATLTASINIKKYISRMTVLYVVSVILGLLGLTALMFTSLVNFITPLNILLAQILFTAITLLPTVLKKP